MSWTSTKRTNEYKLTIITKDGTVISELDGFINGGSVTMEYDSELRRIATISTQNDNISLSPYSMIRIDISTNEGDTASLGTFCIQSRKSVYNNGIESTNYDLASIMYKTKTSLVRWNSHFQGSVRLWDILGGSGCDDGFIHFGAVQGVENWRHNYGGDGIMFNAGTSALEILNTLCSDYGVRYSPKDYWVTIEPYVNPKSKAPIFTFSNDNHSIAGQIEIEDDTYTTINRGIVRCSNSSVNLVGYYDETGSTGVSPAVRQQYIAQAWDENEISPQTQEAVNNSARKHVKDSQHGNRTYTFNGVFVGVREGDVVNLILNNKTIKCLVSSIQLTLNAAMNCQYKLKEV